MRNIKIGICDDDMRACLSLAKKISKELPEAAVRLFTSGEELLAADYRPDLLFMDVRLSGIDGMETAHRLRRHDENAMIIFVSGYPDYVFDAFDVGALHYLVKPFRDSKLRDILQKACAQLHRKQEREPHLLISRRGEHTSVRYRDILWAEVFNRIIVLHTTYGEISYYGKMAQLSHQLGPDFFRTHRAYLVNFRYVDGYSADSVQINGERIPMARKKSASFAELYMDYIRQQGSLQ